VQTNRVQRAFGNFVGWINAYNIISANFTTLAMYPGLFIAYLPVQLNWWESTMIQVAFLAVVVIINIIGVDFLSRLSLAILFVILLPFVIEIVAIPTAGYFEPRALLEARSFAHIDWALFISVIIWNLDGFDIMGAMAGEVEGGRSTYIQGPFARSLSLSLVIVIIRQSLGLLLADTISATRR
jgi:amino acid transporter